MSSVRFVCSLVFFNFVSQREKFCSHLNAGLQMLVYWFENPDKVGTVRCFVSCCIVVAVLISNTRQCVRAALLRKPDVELRKHPLPLRLRGPVCSRGKPSC
jgi:hypothetical protein